jgi:hypothetical protein
LECENERKAKKNCEKNNCGVTGSRSSRKEKDRSEESRKRKGE